jgi:two-component system sensor histidine kinase BaeS
VSRLVDDLRTLANAESGTLTLRKEPTDLAALIQEVVRSFAGDAQSKQISIRSNLPPDLPIITIDPLRIREALVNIISNAVRHTPEAGNIAVAAGVENERMVVSVTDSGPGISPQDLAKIFDRFYKGATSRGSGLGLTIARSLINGHGGEIRAENIPGNGAMLTFFDPEQFRMTSRYPGAPNNDAGVKSHCLRVRCTISPPSRPLVSVARRAGQF